MSEKSSSSSSGIGFVGMLTILFIALKLLGKIDWSWWWVLSPIWISAGIILIIVAFVVAVEFWPKKKTPPKVEDRVIKKSKFMEKLEEAMKASEEKRNQN